MEEEKKPNEDLLNPDDFEEEEVIEETEDSDTEVEEEPSEESQTEKSMSQDDLEKERIAKKNAHFAEQRRQKEAKEREERERKIREEAELKGALGVLRTNPYTDEPIRDEEDLRIYKLQKELDDEGKDPIADLPRKIAEVNRKANAEAKAKLEKESADKKARDDKIYAEIAELREKYPKVDTAKLANDELFKECLKGRAGRWSQLEIYELYLSKKAEADKKAEEEKMKNKVDESADKLTKTPSSQANGKVSPKDVSKMTDEEFEAYWKEKYGN